MPDSISTRCWWCNQKLLKRKDTKELIFVVITDPVGNQHKVHIRCRGARFKEFQELSSYKKPSHD